jgi:hypothetical protein
LTAVSHARSLKVALRRELSPPKDGVRLLLRPESAAESAAERRHLDQLQSRESTLPPCRVVWIGDLQKWGEQLHVTALVERPVSGPTLATVLVPLTSLRQAIVARILSDRPITSDRSGSYIAGGPVSTFAAHQWWIDRWFGSPEMVVVTAAEAPALAIATLAGRPRFASSPLCVVADRAAKRLVVIPSWEIFRSYDAGSDRLPWSTFRFPSPSTLDDLLEGFDGHAFVNQGRWARPAPEEAVRASEPWRYAGERLVAVGRDTVVGYALTGRAHIRALPPFRGAAQLLAVAVEAQLGEYTALFAQRIVGSGPGESDPGIIRWTPAPS